MVFIPPGWVPQLPFVHRLSGIVTPASAAYSVSELEHQLRSSGANALITCIPLLDVALAAAKSVGILHDRIFILSVPGSDKKAPFKTIDDLVEEGRNLPELQPLNWAPGQGARQVAFLSFSSGTSGLPKAVKISHLNVISNIIQISQYNSVGRHASGVSTLVSLGLLPFSHIYGLVVVAHCGLFSGDEVIVLPSFEPQSFLSAIERFRIEVMSVVPPILIQLLNKLDDCAKYDLSSIRIVYTGAAPLASETAEDVLKAFPKWRICQAYGLTETATGVTATSELDISFGSSGSLLPSVRAKIVDAAGKEITEHGTPGELLVQSPSVALGYLNNEQATAETFVFHSDGRWMKTGDEALVRKSAEGNEHFVIIDRIKELIKVKGHQVAPAELEAHLLAHPFVSDCAVIQVPNDRAGEAPKAFIVKALETSGKQDDEVVASINKHVEEHKAKYKWLKGGIEFIEVIPKSPSGKILRRLLRDEEKKARKAKLARL
ncbi:hypothetical protein NCS57_01493000 [Fusarium keratoplasticum]|uniref:Uncharacterized protein n=1 Tax=Fusarium keratoplasticum TaxID=1328300 RepID=A0ACC0QAR5_9HYPO|nr:hypothetical protein NCS57_01493000 [Fusarium keratoplasticum]KAI8648249.1 hypothetical protein NCS57_01493000 [Fusarium keratoplasticum]